MYNTTSSAASTSTTFASNEIGSKPQWPKYNLRPRKNSVSDVSAEKLAKRDVNKGTAINVASEFGKTNANTKTVKLSFGSLTWDSQMPSTNRDENSLPYVPSLPLSGAVGRKTRRRTLALGAISPPVSKTFTKRSSSSPKGKRHAPAIKNVPFNLMGIPEPLPLFYGDAVDRNHNDPEHFSFETSSKGASLNATTTVGQPNNQPTGMPESEGGQVSKMNWMKSAVTKLKNVGSWQSEAKAPDNVDTILITSFTGRKVLVPWWTQSAKYWETIEILLSTDALYKNSVRLHELAESTWFMTNRVPIESHYMSQTRSLHLCSQLEDVRKIRSAVKDIFKRRTVVTVQIENIIPMPNDYTLWKVEALAAYASPANPVVINMSMAIVKDLIKNMEKMVRKFQVLNALTCPMESQLVDIYRRIFSKPVGKLIRVESVGMATCIKDSDDSDWEDDDNNRYHEDDNVSEAEEAYEH